MAWTVRLSEAAKKQLRKIDQRWQAQILDYLEQRIATAAEPRRFGKALSADLKGFWRYRVGNYRIICDIQHQVLVVLVVKIGHRSDIYR